MSFHLLTPCLEASVAPYYPTLESVPWPLWKACSPTSGAMPSLAPAGHAPPLQLTAFPWPGRAPLIPTGKPPHPESLSRLPYTATEPAAVRDFELVQRLAPGELVVFAE